MILLLLLITLGDDVLPEILSDTLGDGKWVGIFSDLFNSCVTFNKALRVSSPASKIGYILEGTVST